MADHALDVAVSAMSLAASIPRPWEHEIACTWFGGVFCIIQGYRYSFPPRSSSSSSSSPRHAYGGRTTHEPVSEDSEIVVVLAWWAPALYTAFKYFCHHLGFVDAPPPVLLACALNGLLKYFYLLGALMGIISVFYICFYVAVCAVVIPWYLAKGVFWTCVYILLVPVVFIRVVLYVLLRLFKVIWYVLAFLFRLLFGGEGEDTKRTKEIERQRAGNEFQHWPQRYEQNTVRSYRTNQYTTSQTYTTSIYSSSTVNPPPQPQPHQSLYSRWTTQSKPRYNRTECIICTDSECHPPNSSNSSTSTSFESAPCKTHHFCIPCLSRLYLRATTDETLYPPSCCKTPFPLETLYRTNLSLENQYAYLRAIREFSTPVERRIYCSTPRCSIFLLDSTSARIRTSEDAYGFKCVQCQGMTCVRCGASWHPGEKCSREVGGDVKVTLELGDKMGWRRCRCGFLVELRERCNHILCRCGHQFCYLCGKPWKTCHCPQNIDGQTQTRRLQGVVEPQLQRASQSFPTTTPDNSWRRNNTMILTDQRDRDQQASSPSDMNSISNPSHAQQDRPMAEEMTTHDHDQGTIEKLLPPVYIPPHLQVRKPPPARSTAQPAAEESSQPQVPTPQPPRSAATQAQSKIFQPPSSSSSSSSSAKTLNKTSSEPHNQNYKTPAATRRWQQQQQDPGQCKHSKNWKKIKGKHECEGCGKVSERHVYSCRACGVWRCGGCLGPPFKL